MKSRSLVAAAVLAALSRQVSGADNNAAGDTRTAAAANAKFDCHWGCWKSVRH